MSETDPLKEKVRKQYGIGDFYYEKIRRKHFREPWALYLSLALLVVLSGIFIEYGALVFPVKMEWVCIWLFRIFGLIVFLAFVIDCIYSKLKNKEVEWDLEMESDPRKIKKHISRSGNYGVPMSLVSQAIFSLFFLCWIYGVFSLNYGLATLLSAPLLISGFVFYILDRRKYLRKMGGHN